MRIDDGGNVIIDSILEQTPAAGVTIDACLIKDGQAADSIKIRGRTVATTAPSDLQTLKWNNGASQWEPGAQFKAASKLVTRVLDAGDYYADGVADDVQINAAVTAVIALGGGTVLLREGIYTIASTVNISGSDVAIEGCGQGAVVRAADGLGDDTAIFLVDHATGLANVTFRNCWIQGSSGANKEYGVQLGSTLTTPYRITNTVFDNAFLILPSHDYSSSLSHPRQPIQHHTIRGSVYWQRQRKPCCFTKPVN